MEDVLGGRTRPVRFSEFLANWEILLAQRVEEAVTAFSAINGVRGLILAGSFGRGAPWPLSDIDFLPIFDDSAVDSAREEIEHQRRMLMAGWIDEGWWTGLDIGRLVFTHNEIVSALQSSGPKVTMLLRDDRWYHSMDKGYRGCAIFDPDGLASLLVNWITEHRFSPLVVQHRLGRAWGEADQARHLSFEFGKHGDPLGTTIQRRSAASWLMTWQLEHWGEQDRSLGRVGTRFERLAQSYGRSDLVNALRDLNDLHDQVVEQRMAVAPDWVWERRDRSFCARRHVGDEVTRLEDARDTLRVCVMYESRRLSSPPFPNWLAIPTDVTTMHDNARRLSTIMDHWMSGNSAYTP